MRDPASALPAADCARQVRDLLPPGGLFADLNWRIATRPFALDPAIARELESLGRVLHQFYRAANLLYRRSVEGKAPPWVALWLDQGKPAELIALQRDPAFRNDTPKVIRPDLLLTESALALTELDSVPGGIGLTTWLYETYQKIDRHSPEPIPADCWIGSGDRLRRGFAGLFEGAPRIHLIVSQESATYRPEMTWLAEGMPGAEWRVQEAAFTQWTEGDGVYRFFELFDLQNVPAAWPAFEAARQRRIRLTPPPKPLFEEKLLLALLWNRHLRTFWRQELGEAFLNRMLKLVPYSWALDPTPLPPQGAIPELGLTDWNQLKTLTQRERDLILKVSGYSEEAWGARGVHLGSDLSSADWSVAVDEALAAWPRSPHVLQRYHRPRLDEARWYDFANEAEVVMPARVRLCPYYFVHGEGDAARPHLGGVLATACPADKKIIHGMRDAVLAPCVARRPGPPA